MTRTRRTLGARRGRRRPRCSPRAATHRPAPPATAPVTLSYFTFSAAPDHLEDLDAIVAAFEEENPNITIEVQTAAYADYFTSCRPQIAGGTRPTRSSSTTRTS